MRWDGPLIVTLTAGASIHSRRGTHEQDSTVTRYTP